MSFLINGAITVCLSVSFFAAFNAKRLSLLRLRLRRANPAEPKVLWATFFRQQKPAATLANGMLVAGCILLLIQQFRSTSETYWTFFITVVLVQLVTAVSIAFVRAFSQARLEDILYQLPVQWNVLRRDFVRGQVIRWTPYFSFLLLIGLALGNENLIWRFSTFGAITLISACYMIAAPSILAWQYDVTDISQSSWAELAPRIDHWSTISGVRFRHIWVVNDKTRKFSTTGSGLWRPTLFLCDRFLTHSDWRQRDAIITHELGHVYRHDSWRFNGLFLIQRALFFFAIIFLTLIPENGISLLPILAFVALGIYIATIPFYIRLHYHAEYACDQFGVDLTGDPLASVVALHTLTQIDGRPRDHVSSTHPSIQDREAILLERLQDDKRLAPWAHLPVPAFEGEIPEALLGKIVPRDPKAPAPPMPPKPLVQMSPEDIAHLTEQAKPFLTVVSKNAKNRVNLP